MVLRSYDLFEGERDKVKMSIARIREFKPREGYYLAFSGGKDSIWWVRDHMITESPGQMVMFE